MERVALGAAFGVIDRPPGQTHSKAANAFAGTTIIIMPITMIKIESTVNHNVGVLGRAPLIEELCVVARPMNTR